MELFYLFIFSQALIIVSSEDTTCVPRFKKDMFVFKVKYLAKDSPLGNIDFDDCGKPFMLLSDDSHFIVQGSTLKVTTHLTLTEGPKDFNLRAVDAEGEEVVVLVRVLPQRHSVHRGSRKYRYGHNGRLDDHHNSSREHHIHGKHHHKHHKLHTVTLVAEGSNITIPVYQQHHSSRRHRHGHHGRLDGHHNRDSSQEHRVHGKRHHKHHIQHNVHVHQANSTQIGLEEVVPVIFFPKKSSGGLRRSKRAWVAPPANWPENGKGPFPKQLIQIKSTAANEMSVVYSLTGQGADTPPVGVFTIGRSNGIISVTEPLDREKIAKYKMEAHVVAQGSNLPAEEPMELIVNVIDMNDNKPVFNQSTFTGDVPEASPMGYEIVTIVATDLDEPNNDNSDIAYSILSQDPKLPSDNLFLINPVTGVIRVNGDGLDREKIPTYTLRVQAADMAGKGFAIEATVILTVTDSNDNAPLFVQSTYQATVPENQAGVLVTKISVNDGDEPHSPAWNTVFKITSGDPERYFAVATSPTNQLEGIITTAKALDFEKTSQYTLLITAVNEVPFVPGIATSTATVVVNVQDVNEAPIFSQLVKEVAKPEDLAVDSELVQYTATDPDTARSQTVSYKILRDQANWLSVNKTTGVVKVKTLMDRESPFTKDNKYTALIGAYDNDDVPATGTGTLVIHLEDVNDNAPTIDERAIKVCNKDSVPQLLSVTDLDSADFAAPFTVVLQGQSKNNWTAKMNETQTGFILTLVTQLPPGDYNVVLKVADKQGLSQDSTLQATVCDCSGPDVTCSALREAGFGLPAILGVLGAILLLLLLALLLLMFLRRRGGEHKEPLLQEDDIRDNVYYYDEEGGGEDDQDYDLSVLHRGLDNRPEVFRNDVMPNFMPAPQYRPRPANPEDIGNFIDDNLKAADSDPTAPPYDSLLVFDYEGGGSDAGSLSSLNSSSSGDQDYDCLGEWGPRFKKLADMYGGGEDDML